MNAKGSSPLLVACIALLDRNPSKYQIIRHRIHVRIFGRYTSLKDSVKDAPWYLRDRLGWPIEIFQDRPLKSLLRVLCQNIRKVTG